MWKDCKTCVVKIRIRKVCVSIPNSYIDSLKENKRVGPKLRIRVLLLKYDFKNDASLLSTTVYDNAFLPIYRPFWILYDSTIEKFLIYIRFSACVTEQTSLILYMRWYLRNYYGNCWRWRNINLWIIGVGLLVELEVRRCMRTQLSKNKCMRTWYNYCCRYKKKIKRNVKNTNTISNTLFYEFHMVFKWLHMSILTPEIIN